MYTRDTPTSTGNPNSKSNALRPQTAVATPTTALMFAACADGNDPEVKSPVIASMGNATHGRSRPTHAFNTSQVSLVRISTGISHKANTRALPPRHKRYIQRSNAPIRPGVVLSASEKKIIIGVSQSARHPSNIQ